MIGHLLIEPDDFGIARQLPDSGFHLFSGERGRIVSHEFFKFLVELRILESLGDGPA